MFMSWLSTCWIARYAARSFSPLWCCLRWAGWEFRQPRRCLDLARNGDELVVTVGSYRRLLTLPTGLARLRVAGARVEDGELRVRFREPAPAGQEK